MAQSKPGRTRGAAAKPRLTETLVAASDFKARCLKILDDVDENGATIVITKHGRPVARVVPMGPTRKSLAGSWKGRLEITGDIVTFDSSDLWDALK